MQKYQILNLNILLQLIIINLPKIFSIIAKKWIKNLVDKSAISGFINNADLNLKKSSNISNKSWVNAKQDKIIKFLAFDSNYFRDKIHFEDDRN